MTIKVLGYAANAPKAALAPFRFERRDYNESRPHSSLGNMPPLEYTRQHRDFMDSSSSQPPEN
jgi:transposase InsO family protein